jgi:hypothetical protein
MNHRRKANIGDWIKDEFRSDRSLGLVVSTDDETGMMLVKFPKLGKSTWIVREETRGHYVVI